VGVKKGGSSRWLKIVGIVGGLVLVIVIAALLIGRAPLQHASPEAAISSFLTAAFEKFDVSPVLEVIDPQALESQLEAGVGMDEIREALQAGLDEVRREMEREAVSIRFEIEGTELQNGRAETEVTLRFSHPVHGDEEHVTTIATVERDGRWYVYEVGGVCVVGSLIGR
jgi:hypothetical protein